MVAWKTLRTASANLQESIAAGAHAYFVEYITETERFLAGIGQRGFYGRGGRENVEERTGQ